MRQKGSQVCPCPHNCVLERGVAGAFRLGHGGCPPAIPPSVLQILGCPLASAVGCDEVARWASRTSRPPGIRGSLVMRRGVRQAGHNPSFVQGDGSHPHAVWGMDLRHKSAGGPSSHSIDCIRQIHTLRMPEVHLRRRRRKHPTICLALVFGRMAQNTPRWFQSIYQSIPCRTSSLLYVCWPALLAPH